MKISSMVPYAAILLLSSIAAQEPAFLAKPLKPGQVSQLRWTEDRNIVHPNMYRVGLPPSLPQTLKKYCDAMNITQMLMDWTIGGNEKPEGYREVKEINGNDWFIQRPGGQYSSDMHWISPHGPGSQQDFLAALGAGGLGEVLEAIGNTVGFESMTVFQITFLGVSHCTEGYVHWDTTETDDKAFVLIIPILLADNDSTPELLIRSMEYNDEGYVEHGLYKYEHNVGILLGDDAFHGTAPVDYRGNGGFRMGATIYIADITEDNAESVANAYSQEYPPPDDRDLILSWSGMHWNSQDPNVSLPKPTKGHVLYQEDQEL